jgi:hypothetical protein
LFPESLPAHAQFSRRRGLVPVANSESIQQLRLGLFLLEEVPRLPISAIAKLVFSWKHQRAGQRQRPAWALHRRFIGTKLRDAVNAVMKEEFRSYRVAENFRANK